MERKAEGADSKMKLRKEFFNIALLTSIESTVQPKETRSFYSSTVLIFHCFLSTNLKTRGLDNHPC